jgi:hypothetical protein
MDLMSVPKGSCMAVIHVGIERYDSSSGSQSLCYHRQQDSKTCRIVNECIKSGEGSAEKEAFD